jgi:hypothetical protein
MTDDESRGGHYGGPPNPWAVPGASAPFGAVPVGEPQRPRSRVLRWIAGVLIVILLIAGAGFVIYDNHQASRSAAALPAVASSSSPRSAAPSPATSSAPNNSPSPQSSPRSASPSTGQPSAPALGAGPTTAAGPLDQYVLAPAEVGANSMMFLIDGGRSTGDQATLDWCNYKYTSEALRMTRVQVEYTGTNSLPAGNEFVHYQKGGATRAWTELQQAVASCPPTSTVDGYTDDMVQRAPADDELVARQIVLSYRVTDPTGQLNLQWQSVVYQFDGDYFSGIYVYGLTRSSALTEAERLAAKSATHLAQAARGKPGTGGGQIQSVASSPPDTGIQD